MHQIASRGDLKKEITKIRLGMWEVKPNCKSQEEMDTKCPTCKRK